MNKNICLKFLVGAIFFLTIAGCGGGGGGSDDGSGGTPVNDENNQGNDNNPVSALIFTNPDSNVAAILSNELGAMVFYATKTNGVAAISKVVIVENSGPETAFYINDNLNISLTNNAPTQPIASSADIIKTKALADEALGGELHTEFIEDSIDGVNDFAQDNLDRVSPGAMPIARDLKEALEKEKINPESFKDKINRFFTDKIIECLNNTIVDCVNSFRESIGGDSNVVATDGSTDTPAGESRLLEPGDISIVDESNGIETIVPVQKFTTFGLSRTQGEAPLDVSAFINEDAALNLHGEGVQHSWSYHNGDANTAPIVFGSGYNGELYALEPGTYTITLTVRSLYGGTIGKASKTVTVKEADNGSDSVVNSGSGDPGSDDSGTDGSGSNDSGSDDSGTDGSGSDDTGSGDSGSGSTGSGDSGSNDGSDGSSSGSTGSDDTGSTTTEDEFSISSSVESGSAPLTVTFTIRDPIATNFRWNVTGYKSSLTGTSSPSNEITFDEPGIYKVYAQPNGRPGYSYDLKSKDITVLGDVVATNQAINVANGSPAHSWGATLGGIGSSTGYYITPKNNDHNQVSLLYRQTDNSTKLLRYTHANLDQPQLNIIIPEQGVPASDGTDDAPYRPPIIDYPINPPIIDDSIPTAGKNSDSSESNINSIYIDLAVDAANNTYLLSSRFNEIVWVTRIVKLDETGVLIWERIIDTSTLGGVFGSFIATGGKEDVVARALYLDEDNGELLILAKATMTATSSLSPLHAISGSYLIKLDNMDGTISSNAVSMLIPGSISDYYTHNFYPADMMLDAVGNLYLTDAMDLARVRKFDSDLNQLWVAAYNSNLLLLTRPYIEFDELGNVMLIKDTLAAYTDGYTRSIGVYYDSQTGESLAVADAVYPSTSRHKIFTSKGELLTCDMYGYYNSPGPIGDFTGLDLKAMTADFTESWHILTRSDNKPRSSADPSPFNECEINVMADGRFLAYTNVDDQYGFGASKKGAVLIDFEIRTNSSDNMGTLIKANGPFVGSDPHTLTFNTNDSYMPAGSTVEWKQHFAGSYSNFVTAAGKTATFTTQGYDQVSVIAVSDAGQPAGSFVRFESRPNTDVRGMWQMGTDQGYQWKVAETLLEGATEFSGTGKLFSYSFDTQNIDGAYAEFTWTKIDNGGGSYSIQYNYTKSLACNLSPSVNKWENLVPGYESGLIVPLSFSAGSPRKITIDGGTYSSTQTFRGVVNAGNACNGLGS